MAGPVVRRAALSTIVCFPKQAQIPLPGKEQREQEEKAERDAVSILRVHAFESLFLSWNSLATIHHAPVAKGEGIVSRTLMLLTVTVIPG